MDTLETRIRNYARDLGFELVGIAPAVQADGFEHLRQWLAQGFEGAMNYMSQRAEARRHPASILPEVRSVVMVGMNYGLENNGLPRYFPLIAEREEVEGVRPNNVTPHPNPLPQGEREPEAYGTDSESFVGAERQLPAMGKVARYARGLDYHDVLRQRLNQLLAWIQREKPDCRGRGVVDTAPLLERDFARRAGLGWFGKNTMLINKRQGSYFFLGALLLNVELQPDAVHTAQHCGTCTACLSACPTEAFVQPGMLDSRRCLSYLTIELRDSVPSDLRSQFKDWLFGCDICQEVCPWNRKSPGGAERAFSSRPDLEAIDLAALLECSEEEFRRRFRGTALMRAKRRGLLRNAALILGNRGDLNALPALQRAQSDPEPLIQEAATWAIEQILLRQKANPSQLDE